MENSYYTAETQKLKAALLMGARPEWDTPTNYASDNCWRIAGIRVAGATAQAGAALQYACKRAGLSLADLPRN